MSDSLQRKSHLSLLSQSEGWRIICEAIEDNINRLDKLINDDSPDGALNDEKIYTARILNIKQKKILQKLKDYPKQIAESEEPSFKAEDILEGLL